MGGVVDWTGVNGWTGVGGVVDWADVVDWGGVAVVAGGAAFDWSGADVSFLTKLFYQ